MWTQVWPKTQKFRKRIKRFYTIFKSNWKRKEKTTEFYDDMQALFSNKHSITPVALINTLVPSQEYQMNCSLKL